MAESPIAVAEDFSYIANAIHGLYLDASMAIGELARHYMAQHSEHLTRLRESGQPMTQDSINPAVIYTRGDGPGSDMLHHTTIVDLIERNRIDGRHMQFLARMCIVALYQYWEDVYRARLAAACRVSQQQLQHDALGELRGYRRSILHRNGRAIKELSSNTVLPSVQDGAEIVLDYDALRDIIESVKLAVTELAARNWAA